MSGWKSREAERKEEAAEKQRLEDEDEAEKRKIMGLAPKEA